MDALSESQILSVDIGQPTKRKARLTLRITPGGLLAIGALIAATLVATSVLVRESKATPRRTSDIDEGQRLSKRPF
jgi:hypothetical protein